MLLSYVQMSSTSVMIQLYTAYNETEKNTNATHMPCPRTITNFATTLKDATTHAVETVRSIKRSPIQNTSLYQEGLLKTSTPSVGVSTHFRFETPSFILRSKKL